MASSISPADSRAELEAAIRTVNESPTAAGYLSAARRVRQSGDHLQPVRVALLGTFTVDPVVPFLEVEAARLGFKVHLYVAPFNTIGQELVSPASGCVRHAPDVVFVAPLLEDLAPSLADDFGSLDRETIDRTARHVVSSLAEMITAFRQQSSSAVVVQNFSLPRYPGLGVGEAMEEHSQTAVIRALNHDLALAAGRLTGVYILDADRLAGEVGYHDWRDPKMWYLGRAALSGRALRVLGRQQATFIRALTTAPRKCLVLDLDNTLWGGVVGEAGVAGIKLGHGYPGNVFRDFQRAALQLHRRGVLLALNSKNNLSDVEEVFRSHPDMILALRHFASVRVNWRPKPDNMRDIARELNIGVDSLVFVDDDPTECALMRASLPEVLTLDAVADPLARLEALRGLSVFDKLGLTTEDRRRGHLYRTQTEREEFRQSSLSVEAFLQGLDIEVRIQPIDEFSFPRAVDLLQKTNQFNLTTRRHTAPDLAKWLASPTQAGFCVSVTDRFGDNGIVGLALVASAGSRAVVDTLLLSCRVIGRQIETALLAFLVDWAIGRDAAMLEGQFVPTAKNAPAADFYERHGFTRTDGVGGSVQWTLALSHVPFAWPTHIRRAESPTLS